MIINAELLILELLLTNIGVQNIIYLDILSIRTVYEEDG